MRRMTLEMLWSRKGNVGWWPLVTTIGVADLNHYEDDKDNDEDDSDHDQYEDDKDSDDVDDHDIDEDDIESDEDDHDHDALE